MRVALRLTSVATAFFAMATAAVGAHAPSAPISSLAELPTPLPAPYDSSADAARQVAAAKARARASGKLLLIDLGGNWCPDCRILAGFMQLPTIAAFIDAHYVVVMVDAGHMDRNLDIPARWGVNSLVGVPSVLIVDRHDHLVNAGHTAALDDARSMSPQALTDWLARWTP